MNETFYETTIPGGAHWSLRMRTGTRLKLTDIEGGGSCSVLLYNPENLLERYNAPDTLKCQHTFKLTRGHCLYSDMGRIFCSIVDDSLGWHETVCGSSNPAAITAKYGARDYQHDRNDWNQNGHDAFLVELAKYGLGRRDLAANINFFTKVEIAESGALAMDPDHSPPGANVTLRFDLDTLVVLHTCPHPLNPATAYPRNPIGITLSFGDSAQPDDFCMNFRPENIRGFRNNALYRPSRGVAT